MRMVIASVYSKLSLNKLFGGCRRLSRSVLTCRRSYTTPLRKRALASKLPNSAKGLYGRNVLKLGQCLCRLQFWFRNWLNWITSLPQCKCTLQCQHNIQNISKWLASPSSFEVFWVPYPCKCICAMRYIHVYNLFLQHITQHSNTVLRQIHASYMLMKNFNTECIYKIVMCGVCSCA